MAAATATSSCFYIILCFSLSAAALDEADVADNARPAPAPEAAVGGGRLCGADVPRALLAANRDPWPHGAPAEDPEDKYAYDTLVWRYGGTPATDDIDRFMINRTGCTYGAGWFSEERPLGAEPYDGAHFERRVALRARGHVALRLALGHDDLYYFIVGSGDNNITEITQPRAGNYWKLSTPRILSADRYLPLYVRIHAGTLSFGAACGGEPLFARAVSAPAGAALAASLEVDHIYGAKFLYDCPTDQ